MATKTYDDVALPMRSRAADPITEEEARIREDLAAAYRLVALFGWDDLIYTHISARVPGPEHHFLVNPLGLGFDEITPESLVKIDLDGTVIGDSPLPPNAAGFVIHGGIHAVREDAGCIMHLHTEAGMALSMLEDGLDTTLSQHAMRFHGRIAYHDYEGIALAEGERERIVADLGDKPALVFRNHGTLTIGRTVGHAFVEMFYLEKAARTQLAAQATGKPLRRADREVVELTARQWKGIYDTEVAREWPALRRRLERLDPEFRELTAGGAWRSSLEVPA